MDGVADMVDSVWMTKAELAALHRISSGSANRLIRRQRWARRRGNDGRTHVLVPKPWAEACAVSERTSASRGFELNAETGAEHDQLAAMVGGLQAEVARLRAEAEAAQLARRQMETERDQERQGREVAERAAEDARQRAEEAIQAAQVLRKARESRAAEDRAAQVTREAAAAQLRRLTEAMAARRSLGRWARLLTAWRGE
jgi:hypothetical protein